MGFGPLEVIRTYAYYDRPLVFLADAPSIGQLLFVLADIQDDRDRWLALPVTRQRVQDLEAHRLTLRHALLRPEPGWLYQVFTANHLTAVPTIVREIAEEDMPTEDSWITSQAATVDILEVHLRHERLRDHLIEPVTLGAFLQKLSNSLSSAVQAHPRDRVERLFLTRAFTPGSFGIILESTTLTMVPESSKQAQAVYKVDALFRSDGFDKITPKARRDFYYLLKVLTGARYGVNFNWRPHRGSPLQTTYALDELQSLLVKMEEMGDLGEETRVFRGYIAAADQDRKTFRFRTEDNRRITGLVPPEMYNQPITLLMNKNESPLVEIKIREISHWNEITYQEMVTYILESIQPITGLDLS